MLQAFIIFCLMLTLLPISTIRTILLVKGETNKASLIGALEALVNILSLGIIFSDTSNILNIIGYCLGFSAGLFVGGFLERKLAIGYVTLQVMLLEKSQVLIKTLRDSGFGVTVFEGEGIDSTRYRLEVLAKRTHEKKFITIIDELAPKAFVVSYEPRIFRGGFLLKNLLKKEKE